MKPLLLINPNRNAGTTTRMVRLARSAAPNGLAVVGVTMDRSVAIIWDADRLRIASEVIAAYSQSIASADWSGVIVGAFSDPGLSTLRASLKVPITGLAEASFLAVKGRQVRCAVVTTTPKLRQILDQRAAAYGLQDRYVGTYVTRGDPEVIMADPAKLVPALRDAALAATKDGAQSLIVGGGPLGEYASALREGVAVDVIEPVATAVRLAAARTEGKQPWVSGPGS